MTPFLRALDSLTKYPSIPTYHPMGDRGVLQPLPEPVFPPGETLWVYEKIDGCNVRIVLMDGTRSGYPETDWIIGSREEFLMAKGDRIGNPKLGIIDTVAQIASSLDFHEMCRVFSGTLSGMPKLKGFVVFGEFYGGSQLPASKYYTSDRSLTGFRVFDVVKLRAEDMAKASNGSLEGTKGLEQIASWRDNGGQQFLDEGELDQFCAVSGLSRVPCICQCAPSELRADFAGMLEWMQGLQSSSRAKLDAAASGKMEGYVVSDRSRRIKRKLRFEDYERALRLSGKRLEQ